MIKLTLPMPRLGETLDSGTIAGWNVAEAVSYTHLTLPTIE